MFRRKPVSSPAKSKQSSLSVERPVKRLKREEDAESESDDKNVIERPRSPDARAQRVVADSDADSQDEGIEDGDTSATQRTDLEQTLPQISTDREAIQQYEAMRAAESASSPEGSSQGARYKSSIYVDAFFLALDTVLEEESHLFNEAEMKVFEQWRNLSYEAQYLYVRLFLRKTSAWHRINRLGYHSDIGNMDLATDELFKRRQLPASAEETTFSPGELQPPEGAILTDSFTFADSSTDHISTLEEASSLLLLDELKALAKEAKVQGKNKTDLLKALRRTSGKQTSLSFAPNLKRSDTDDSLISTTDDHRGESPSKSDNRDAHFTSKILSSTGPCIRLSEASRRLFERVHLVFYRSTEWTEKSLTTIILARIARRNFPNYIVSRSANIFPSRSLLLEFEASLRTQFRIDSTLEFNGTPTKEGLQIILDIFDEVYPRWKILLAEEQKKEDSIYATGEGAYLRRLSPAWVYTRIVHKGAYVLGLGKFKDHAREHEVLSELLAQRLFHAARRGAWYQRKALLEEHYMAALRPLEGRTPEEQKKHYKRVALRTCEAGLQDNLVHLIYHYDLQKRITKLERQLKIAARLQHDFSHSRLAKPIEREVVGTQITKPPPRRPSQPLPHPAQLSRSNSNSNSTTTAKRTHPGKTIWLDPADPNTTCSVESMCLSHYRSLGWKGFHTESGIVRTLFALLFHDILFTYVPNVFQTPFQTCPLDLHTDGFYVARMGEIERRLADIGNGKARALVAAAYEELDRLDEKGAPRRTCVVGLDWGFEKGDVLEICECVGPGALATVCRVLCEEYAQRGGGMPDLFLWRPRRVHDGEHGEKHGEEHPEIHPEIHPKDRHEKQPNHQSKTTSQEHTSDISTSKKQEQPEPKDPEADAQPTDNCADNCAFIEVKSSNDRLSDTQRLWIHVLSGAGVRVEVCRAIAGEVLTEAP
ncbi:MAG: hypothetical protein M1828_005379 [Chrysothrix sp. TS-e1954]|nr:MAG: hypothetical protein M1828_005379 [Chrysothrix sp. TS-e1954]